MTSNWYENFFHGLALDFWRAAVTPQLTANEVDFAVAELHLDGRKGARVLDCPCGNGRHSLELARRGYAVTGIDISNEFLAEARANARAAALPIEFLLRDMSAIEGESRFDAAVCFGNSFGYLSHASTQRFLSGLARALVPGGRLLIDTGALAESLLPNLEERFEMEMGGVRMTVDHRYDALKSRMEATYVFQQGDRVERSDMNQHVYSAGELVRMLEAAGFSDVTITGGGEMGAAASKPFALGDAWARVVATRS